MRHLIALDLDGTLEDSRADMVAAAHRVRAELGLAQRGDAELLPFVNGGMDRLYTSCFDDYLAAEPAAAAERYGIVKEAYESDYLAHVAVETRLYDGIAATLDQLETLGVLACVTNKPERISRALLNALGVGELFAAVIGGDSCPDIKPNPIMLAAATERSGFDPTQGRVFMIGDTAGDIQMGRAFGATTVWCAWGYSETPGEKADFEVKRPEELMGIVYRG